MNKTIQHFLLVAFLRALKTFAQTAASLFTVGQAFFDVPWKAVISISFTAALYSIVTSIASIDFIENKKEEEPKEAKEV